MSNANLVGKISLSSYEWVFIDIELEKPGVY